MNQHVSFFISRKMNGNIINFDETKIRDIMDKYSVCKYDDFEILYLKDK